MLPESLSLIESHPEDEDCYPINIEELRMGPDKIRDPTSKYKRMKIQLRPKV